MILELAEGAALLLALCYLESVIRRVMPMGVGVSLIVGALFGLVTIVGMMTPVNLAPGVIFDARSVVLGVAGLTGGPIVGGVAALLAGGYRIWLGGAGAPVGVGVVVSCVLLGLAYRAYGKRDRRANGFLGLLAFGLVLHLVCVGWFSLLPAEVWADVRDNIAVPFVLVFTPATAFLAWLIADSHRRQATDADLIRATGALRASENRFRAVVENSPNGITLKDRNGRYLVVNPTFAAWQNEVPENLIGHTLADLVPSGQATDINERDAIVIAKDEMWTGEGIRNFADGVERYVDVTKVPVALDSEQPNSVLTILTDVTETKRAERELMKARDEAVTANRAKSDFLAKMSHEFRTPLNAIIGFSDIIAHRRLGPATEGRSREYAADINRSAAMLLELVNDLLDIAAIEDGRVPIERQPLDVVAVVDESVNTLRSRMEDKGIAMVIDIAEDPAPLSADRRAVKQILLNLLGNSLKFTPAGGRIVLGAEQDADSTTFRVEDTGIGIAPADLARLNAASPALTGATYKTEEGWGLGLVIVRGLVALHGGRMQIESTLGHGTKVTVTIPNA